MKFSAAIVSLSFLYGASAFAPNSRVGISTTAPAALNNGFAQIGSRTATDASSTELGLFFMNTMKRRSEAKKAGNAKTGDAITEKEVRALFDLWNSALATGDSRIVANRYAKNPVLLPTVSDEPRTDFDSVKDYFDSFLLKKPQGKILDGQIHIGDGWASDMGIYEFTMGATGDKVKARYTYNYIKEDGVWKIQHHHSSVLPEEVAMGKAITEDEVRGLFSLWNNALATLDPKKVASRYAKKGVLLPTVSDVPRTDFTSIEDYFVNFLKLKPQGEILESHVTIGKNWCQDAGIYEFTMGATGKKVKGRYSFVYVYEDGEWKISHHHSSVMPEATMPKAISEEEVRGLFQLWNGALATLDPDAVARRYSKNAVLLPTVSDVPRTDYGLIKDYFVGFLTKKPQGEILESNVIVGHNWCQDAGIYEFTMGATGDKVKGRYTFVYVYEDGEWKIAHHHSSVMPEAFLGPSPKPDIKDTMSEQEVAGLFELWNSALATGDSHIVASRYAKKPILLATVSDEPRTDYSSIKNYFDSFLLKKPQGKIIDRKIHVGKGWATDMGIYEFTMGATGDKVKARYTFNYIREGGEWKIQHHHSSVMPEGIDMGKAIKEDEVRGLFSLWNNALATLDPKKVASRYAKKGVLLPTVSDIPRTDSSSIEDYFVNFLKLKPQGEILESHVTIGQNWCQDAGIYEFTMGATGKKVKGRYSFVYVYEDGEWKISHHHSSVMPEGLAPKAISEEEVRNLFQLWNGALATLDPDAVARRYSKNAVLLPTVSDVPRTSYDLIQDYFVGFLTKKPQGEILESNVTIGHNWCQDAGIYEFTMGATGDKVKGRYSFVYVYEDGEWKIAHHHSSVMPEAILGPSPKPAVVEEEELVMA